jgi:two-component system, OmpR family, response regulator
VSATDPGAAGAGGQGSPLPAMRRLLLIDDDALLGPPLAAFFRRSDFELVHALRPSAGLALLKEGGFDAAILDVMLPEMDGFALCRTIRRDGGAQRDLPILMLTARGDVMDRVVGLELGADDYLPKPFEPRELLARLQTILRRVPAVAPADPVLSTSPLRFEDLLIDLERRSVVCCGHVVELTGTEFELLVMLASAPHKVFSRDDILARLRGHAAEDIHSRAVDILVSRLRRKLAPLDVIRTLRNAGYLFAGARL